MPSSYMQIQHEGLYKAMKILFRILLTIAILTISVLVSAQNNGSTTLKSEMMVIHEALDEDIKLCRNISDNYEFECL